MIETKRFGAGFERLRHLVFKARIGVNDEPIHLRTDSFRNCFRYGCVELFTFG